MSSSMYGRRNRHMAMCHNCLVPHARSLCLCGKKHSACSNDSTRHDTKYHLGLQTALDKRRLSGVLGHSLYVVRKPGSKTCQGKEPEDNPERMRYVQFQSSRLVLQM